MRKLLALLLISISFATVNIRLRPQINIGKMTNGNHYLEVVPLRTSYTPVPEWNIGLGYSLGFEKPRAGGGYNHRGWKTIVKVQFKPLKFMEVFLPDYTITDFAVSYTKQIGDYYEGYTLDVGRLNYADYEEVSIGFDFTI